MCTLRPGNIDDAEVLLRWRNDQETRRWSRSGAPVARHDHLSWLEQTLADPGRLLWIAERAGEPVGTLRHDLDRGRVRAEVSITVASGSRGCGLGRRMHALSLPLLGAAVPTVEHLEAFVHRSNGASLRLFGVVGYRPDGVGEDEHGFVRLVRPAAPLAELRRDSTGSA